MSGKEYIVGIDIGGTTTKIGVVDDDGHIIKRQTLRTDIFDDAMSYAENLAQAIIRLTTNLENLKGIGIGAPNGNHFKGSIDSAHNIKWCKGEAEVRLAEMLHKITGLKVMLTNDANAAAMGEMTYGAARGMRDFILLTLGTGIGSGIVVDGRILYGADGRAGELGHVKIVRNGGRMCGCGQRGCLEAYCSASAVARTAREIVEAGEEDTVLIRIAPEKIDSRSVYEAALAGDPVSCRILAEAGRMLGEAAADFVMFSSPEAIILFGGLSRAGDLIRIPMYDSMNRCLMPNRKGKIRIECSSLPESDAAILGAASLLL